MKKSTWRSKRSPSTESRLSAFRGKLRQDLPFTLTVLAILVGVSCQLSHRGEMDSSTPVGEDASPLAVHPPLAPPTPPPAGKAVKLVQADGKGKATLAELTVADCAAADPALVLAVKTGLTTDYGTNPVRLTVRGAGASETVRAEVEGYRLSFAVTSPVKVRLAKRACEAVAAGKGETVAEPADAEALRDWLSLVSPDCAKLTPGDAAWSCHLPETSPDAARQELAGIQTTMIRRWSRQPYLLARRLAVGMTLAEALEARDPIRRLASFCNIAVNSLPLELPATLASKRWQAAACGPGLDAKHRLAVARFGLGKTVAEVDFLRQLFERTSRLGFLTLRIPSSESPTREVLVSLTPESDVADNLSRETERLWVDDQGGPRAKDQKASAGDMPRACWHPVYGEDGNLLSLARQLDMAGEAARVVCEETTAPLTKTFQPERYFAESITSETEFVLANGRSKTLRLPAGKYAYTLRSLPDDPEEWDDASQVKPHATGEIVWDAKRPRPVISAW